MKRKNLSHGYGLILIRGSDVLKLICYESDKPGFQSSAEFRKELHELDLLK
jgi:hypothetical protein